MRIIRLAQQEPEKDEMLSDVMGEWERHEAVLERSLPALLRDVDLTLGILDRSYSGSGDFIQKFAGVRDRLRFAANRVEDIQRVFGKVPPATSSEQRVFVLADKAEGFLRNLDGEVENLFEDSRVLKDMADEFRRTLTDMKRDLEIMLRKPKA